MQLDVPFLLELKGQVLKYSYTVFSDGINHTTDEELIRNEASCRQIQLPSTPRYHGELKS